MIEIEDLYHIHIPKTAGTTLEASFSNNGNVGAGRGLISPVRGERYPHRSYQQWMETDTPPKNHHKIITFVRNPWDRVFSLYKWLSKNTSEKDFRDWVHEIYENGYTPGIVSFCQYDWLKDRHSNIDHIYFIGRFENLINDIYRLSKMINGYSPCITHQKQSEPVCQNPYDQTTFRLVAEMCKGDLERFYYKEFMGISI